MMDIEKKLIKDIEDNIHGYSDNRILRTMRTLGDNGGYYNPMSIIDDLETNMIAYIVGERRIGKTDYFLHLACKLYLDYGLQTMWIRNKAVELKDPSFASAFLNDAKGHGWCPDNWVTKAEGVFTDEKDGDQVILFQSISTFSNRRGGANPRCLMMVFDEFMPEDRVYPKQCAKGLLSLTKTVFSGNTEARLFCLSNIVSAVNPYFACMRIYPQDTITRYPEKGCLIEKCRGYRKAIMDDNPWQRVYKAGQYGDYADESEDDLISLVIRKQPKEGLEMYDFVLVCHGVVYNVAQDHKKVYFWERKGKVPRNIQQYTPDRDYVSSSVLYIPSWLSRALKGIFEGGYGRFVGANCLFDVMSIIYSDL